MGKNTETEIITGRELNGALMPKPMRRSSRSGMWKLIGSGWVW